MHPLDIVENGFQPEPVHEGRTVVCVGVSAQADYDRWVGTLLERLGIENQSHGLTFDGCAVTFFTPEQASLFKMFYDGETS